MMKNVVNILAGAMFMSGVGILAHQNFMCEGGWFCWGQFIRDLHHETLAVLCFVSAISLLVRRYAGHK